MASWGKDLPLSLNKPLLEGLFSLALIALSLAMAVSTARLPDSPLYSKIGPKLFPSLVAGGMFLTAVALLMGRSTISEEEKSSKVALRPILEVLLGLFLYIWLLNWLGYVLASFLLFLLVCHAFSSQKLGRDAVIGFILALSSFISFTYGLNLTLPEGFWEVLSEDKR